MVYSEYFPISFCPTGMVPKKRDNPNVPTAPSEIADQALEAAELGITSIHIHARDENEDPAWQKEYFEQIISRIKRHNKDLVLCVTTSGRTVTDVERRADSLNIGGELKPDMASLTLASMNFAKQASLNSPDTVKGLLEIMREKDIKPELEVFDTGMLNYAKYLVGKELLKPPFVTNLLFGSPATAQISPLSLGYMLSELPEPGIWLGAGIGDFQLKANALSIAAGGGVRVGLEDNLYFDQERTRLATNFNLLTRVIELGRLLGRRPMPPQMFRENYLG